MVREMLPEHLHAVAVNELRMDALSAALQDRAKNKKEMYSLLHSGDYDFYVHTPELDPSTLVWKDATIDETKGYLSHILEVMEGVSDFSARSIKDSIWEYAGEHGRGSVLWPLRYALTGKERSPDPFSVAAALGKRRNENKGTKGN